MADSPCTGLGPDRPGCHETPTAARGYSLPLNCVVWWLRPQHTALSASRPMTSSAAQTIKYFLPSPTQGTLVFFRIVLSFRTDDLAPVGDFSFVPSADRIFDGHVTLQTSYSGRFCWAVLPTAAGVPSASAVANSYRRESIQPEATLRGKQAIDVPFTEHTITLTDLEPSQDYQFFCGTGAWRVFY